MFAYTLYDVYIKAFFFPEIKLILINNEIQKHNLPYNNSFNSGFFPW